MTNDKILTITEQIVQKLRHDVYSERLQPGSQLKETDIAKRFGVSRGPVKQAFIQLAKEGLLESKPNIGVRVAEKPNKEVHKVFKKLRYEIEIFAACKLIDNFNNTDSGNLDERLERFKTACESGDIIAVRESDFELHEYIISRYEDIHLLDTWNFLILRMMMRYSRHGSLLESFQEHEEIVEAIKNKDKAAVKARLTQNLQ